MSRVHGESLGDRSVKPASKGRAPLNASAVFVGVMHFGPPIAGLCLALAFAAYTAVAFARGTTPAGTAIFRSPRLGGLATSIEALLPHLLLLWAIAGAVLAHAATRVGERPFQRLTRRSELRLQRWLGRLALAACVCLFLFSLMRAWTETTPLMPSVVKHNADYSRYGALLGFLPWSDSYNYYFGARRLVDTGVLDVWNERRPLNAALLAVRLGLTRFDLASATILQVLLLAFCAASASQSLARRLGVWTGVGTTALILAFARLFQATTLSESLGISLGALSIGLLYRGIGDRNGYVAAAGLGAMALGMGARAGAMLAVPCLLATVFISARLFGSARTRVLAAAIVLSVVGFSWSPLLNRAYGTGQGAAGANFAYTAVGLALGSNWGDAERRYADRLAALPSERSKATFLYGQAIALVRQNPRPLLRALWENERMFLDEALPLLRGMALLDAPRTALAYIEAFLLAMGIAAYLIRSGPESTLWVGGWAGVLLSVPLIFGDGGWRALATTWPFMAAFASTGLATRPFAVRTPAGRTRWELSRQGACACVIVLAIAALVGPRLVRAASDRPALEHCIVDSRNGTFLVTRRPDREPAVVVSDGAQPAKKIPTIALEPYKRLVRDGGIEDAATLLDPPSSPFLLVWPYDYVMHRPRQLIAPTALLAVRSKWVWLAAESWKASGYLQHVADYGPWEACQARPMPR